MKKRKLPVLLLTGIILAQAISPSVPFAADSRYYTAGTAAMAAVGDGFMEEAGSTVSDEISDDASMQSQDITEARVTSYNDDIIESEAVISEDGSYADAEGNSAEIADLEETEDVSVSDDQTENLSDESVSDAAADESVKEETVGAKVSSLKEAEIAIKNAVYTGQEVKPAMEVRYTINGSAVLLKEGTDYTVEYKNNINPGTATAVIKGIGAYKDTVKKTFLVTVQMSKTSISYKKIVPNLGKTISNPPTITFQNKTLVKDKDYTVSESKQKQNDARTIVTIKMTGKGFYTGSVSRQYTIINCATKVESGQVYRILLAKDPNMCLGIGSMALENIGIRIREDNTNVESRKFIFNSQGGGKWKIVSQANDYLVRTKWDAAAVGQAVVGKQENGKASDQFNVRYNKDGTFSFISAKSGNAVNIENGQAAAGNKFFMQSPDNSAAQKFYLIPTAGQKHTYSGIYKITSPINSRFVLNVRGGMVRNLTNIDIEQDNNANYQAFRLLYSGGGTYRVQCVHSYSVMTAAQGKMQNLTNLHQDQWTGSSLQKWKLKKNSNGTVTFKSAENEKYAVDLFAGAAISMQNIALYESNNTKAQAWNLKKISERYPSRPSEDQYICNTGQDIVNYAKKWVGKISYQLGANGPLKAGGKSDCSWFVFHVLNHFDLLDSWHKSIEYGKGTVPGTRVVTGGIKNARPGDILVWYEGGNAGHVIIYAGNKMAVGCNGITTNTGSVEYASYKHPCGREPDVIVRMTNIE